MAKSPTVFFRKRLNFLLAAPAILRPHTVQLRTIYGAEPSLRYLLRDLSCERLHSQTKLAAELLGSPLSIKNRISPIAFAVKLSPTAQIRTRVPRACVLSITAVRSFSDLVAPNVLRSGRVQPPSNSAMIGEAYQSFRREQILPIDRLRPQCSPNNAFSTFAIYLLTSGFAGPYALVVLPSTIHPDH